MSVRQPVGIAGLITPWNFPMAIPSWKMTPALMLGNTVVIKPATDTPLSVVNLLTALEEAGLPKGVVNMVTGGGAEVGSPLMHHKDVGIVSFTGSTGVGRKVSVACAPAFKHCHLEMGGKNVIMVMDDANLDLAVEGAVWGGFGTTGQRCTAASRVVRAQEGLRSLHGALRRAGQGAPGRQRPRSQGPDGPLREREPARDRREVRGDRQERRRHAPGRRPAGSSRATTRKGYFHEPTVFGDCDPKMRVAREEIFGPVVSAHPGGLARRGDRGRATRWSTASRPSIYTQDINKAFTAMREMYTGHLLRERAHHRGGDPSALRGHQEHRATATARPASRPSTSSASGSPSTSTTAACCSGRRSTTTSGAGPCAPAV